MIMHVLENLDLKSKDASLTIDETCKQKLEAYRLRAHSKTVVTEPSFIHELGKWSLPSRDESVVRPLTDIATP